MKFIPRTLYLDRIEPYINQAPVKILVGVRRCGKTVLLSQIREKIREHQGEAWQNFIEVDFESRKFESLNSYRALYDYAAEKIRAAEQAASEHLQNQGDSRAAASQEQAQVKTYLFFDEIQQVEGWYSAVVSLLNDFNCDMYLAGSDARLLSDVSDAENRNKAHAKAAGSGPEVSEQAGQAGYFDKVVFPIYPFTLSEICLFYDINHMTYTKEQLFVDYLKYGGLPLRLMLPDEHSVATYLEDVYYSILAKDIFPAASIRNSDLLKELAELLFQNAGTLFSARSIHRTLKEAGRKVTVETVLHYLSLLQKGMLLSKAERYDIKGEVPLTSSEKYYVCDIGLCNSLQAGKQTDYNKLFENIVYLEMCSRGYDVKVGKLSSRNVDFVCTKNGQRVYIQVAYLIIIDQISQEFGSLEKIKDNYPKYVISNDMVDMSRRGICHLNIMDFLLGKQ